jgi:lipopolysaccharide/colanic/teichoic acid biosynthesis glycosyltransferase
MMTSVRAARVNSKSDSRLDRRNAKQSKFKQYSSLIPDKSLSLSKLLGDRLFPRIFAVTAGAIDFCLGFLDYRQLGKRVFDFLFALGVLILFSPLYLFLALLIRLSSPGSVLYVQRRVGRHGKPFSCMKFRTMVVDADLALEELLDRCPVSKAEFEDSFKLKNDPRITPIGKWLRMTSMDEFPQFWNVLVGDMSIVGPRPLVQDELPKYGEAIEEVLTIRPGITGLWQVSGRNDIPYDRRVQIDSRYVRRHSIWLDLEIIFRTIGVVIFPKGNGAY